MSKKNIKILLSICLIAGMVLSMMLYLTNKTVSASEVPLLTLQAEKGHLSGPAQKNGEKVSYIGKNGGSDEGKITFRNLDIPESGYYTLRFTYYSGSDDRYFNLTADGESYRLNCPNSGGFDKKGTVEIEVSLVKNEDLIIGSDWYAPDLDKIEVFYPTSAEFPTRAYRERIEHQFEAGSNTLILDLANGIYTFKTGDITVLKDAHAYACINEVSVESHDFTEHQAEAEGDSITFTHRNHPTFKGTMVQTFRMSEDAPCILTEVTVSGESGVSVNRIAPAAVYENGITVENGVFVRIPYDNDMWVEPAFLPVRKLGLTTSSYEVSAFYDEITGAGLIAGSVEHDTWKTGITVSAYRSEVKGMEVFGGIADDMTRDNSPHGSVSGDLVKSPLIFIGYYSDWMTGLLAFGDANAAVVPPKQSIGQVPFGYNSWGVLQNKVKYSDMTAISRYIRENLQDSWTEDGAAVYVNIDSFWDFLVINDPDCGLTLDEALRAFVKCCHDNGQKAGIYFTPFTAWHSDEAALKKSVVEGTSYTYYDAAVKRSDGSGLYGKLDGGFALDPTHPATIKRFTDKLNYFIELGYEYVKLDFMAHGAVEGKHYEESVKTGMQAYHYGMAKIHEICDGRMYVNLSIAPLFPYQFADGRRISCDAFSSIDNTRHVLSYLTACFFTDSLYPYPDPDHLVVWGKDGSVAEGEARCRVTSGIIAGTSFLVGDNLADVSPGSAKSERITAMFGNREINRTAKLGRMFQPYSVNPGERCADTFWCLADDSLYIAAFNFSEDIRDLTLDLSGKLPDFHGADVTELWRGTELRLTGKVLKASVPAKDAAVYRITFHSEP